MPSGSAPDVRRCKAGHHRYRRFRRRGGSDAAIGPRVSPGLFRRRFRGDPYLPRGKGELSGLIDRAGDLGCALARDGLEFSPGKIYLAVPDHHLILQDGRMPHSEEGMRGRIGEIGKHLQVVQNLLATIRK